MKKKVGWKKKREKEGNRNQKRVIERVIRVADLKPVRQLIKLTTQAPYTQLC